MWIKRQSDYKLRTNKLFEKSDDSTLTKSNDFLIDNDLEWISSDGICENGFIC